MANEVCIGIIHLYLPVPSTEKCPTRAMSNSFLGLVLSYTGWCLQSFAFVFLSWPGTLDIVSSIWWCHHAFQATRIYVLPNVMSQFSKMSTCRARVAKKCMLSHFFVLWSGHWLSISGTVSHLFLQRIPGVQWTFSILCLIIFSIAFCKFLPFWLPLIYFFEICICSLHS